MRFSQLFLFFFSFYMPSNSFISFLPLHSSLRSKQMRFFFVEIEKKKIVRSLGRQQHRFLNVRFFFVVVCVFLVVARRFLLVLFVLAYNVTEKLL